MTVLGAFESLISALEYQDDTPRKSRKDRKSAPAAVVNTNVVWGTGGNHTKQSKGYASESPAEEEYKNEIICKAPGRGSSPPRKKYLMRPGIGEQILELLLDGKYPTQVARELGITPAQEEYYRAKAENKFIIRRIDDQYPLKYVKGPRYQKGLYKKRKNRRSSKFVNPEARVHAGSGDFFRVKAVEGDLHWIKTSSGPVSLFSKELVGKPGKKHFNCELDLPANLLGYEGGKVRLSFYPSKDQRPGVLTISPPEFHLTLDALISTDACILFDRVKDHILSLLSESGGWRFFGYTQLQEVHYAFPKDAFKYIIPELTRCVPSLGRGDNEVDLIIFTDQSVPGGEFETTDRGVAIDLLAMVTVEQRDDSRGA